MSMRLVSPIKVSELAASLSLPFAGPDLEIRELCSLDRLHHDGLAFVLDSVTPPPDQRGGAIFGAAALADQGFSVLVSEQARLDFIRAQYFLRRHPGFIMKELPADVHPSVIVGRGSVIEDGVSIDEGTVIGSCVVIKSGTRIGRHCEIKSGAVIGESGFGFERDRDGLPIKMIHMGGVRIGHHVEIGSLTTVCRGALGDTVLEDHVKLDDHVHIAHNCLVGAGTMITACAELSGSIHVGRDCWLAPNCTIMQKVDIGDNSFIGLGAVVTRSVEAGAKVFGNPAKKLPSSDAPRVRPQPAPAAPASAGNA